MEMHSNLTRIKLLRSRSLSDQGQKLFSETTEPISVKISYATSRQRTGGGEGGGERERERKVIYLVQVS